MNKLNVWSLKSFTFRLHRKIKQTHRHIAREEEEERGGNSRCAMCNVEFSNYENSMHISLSKWFFFSLSSSFRLNYTISSTIFSLEFMHWKINIWELKEQNGCNGFRRFSRVNKAKKLSTNYFIKTQTHLFTENANFLL